MITMKYTLMDIAPDVEWEEMMYHGSVKVVGGIAHVEANDDLSIDAMLRRGFEIVEESAPVEKPAESPAPKKSKKAEPDSVADEA